MKIEGGKGRRRVGKTRGEERMELMLGRRGSSFLSNFPNLFPSPGGRRGEKARKRRVNQCTIDAEQ
jgi:hypothetical protein